MDHLLGKKYKEEIHDCYQLARGYFSMLGIELRDYAFPSDFWDYEDSLYERLFEREGFYSVDSDNWKPRVSDVLLVQGSARVRFPTHLGIVVEDSKVIHHYPGRFSEATPFKGVWRTPTRILRHKSLDAKHIEQKPILITELMPEHVQRRFLPKPVQE